MEPSESTKDAVGFHDLHRCKISRPAYAGCCFSAVAFCSIPTALYEDIITQNVSFVHRLFDKMYIICSNICFQQWNMTEIPRQAQSPPGEVCSTNCSLSICCRQRTQATTTTVIASQSADWRGNLLVQSTILHSKNNRCTGRLPRRFAPRNDMRFMLCGTKLSDKLQFTTMPARIYIQIPDTGAWVLRVPHPANPRKPAILHPSGYTG